MSTSFQMKKIILAVGSKRGPKLNAVNEALGAFAAVLAPETQFEVVGVEVESGVSHTPASREELMRGARQRAEALAQLARKNGAVWQYFVSLEGGLDVVHESASPYEIVRDSASRQNGQRSEEHTSELQSLAYLVCRLLLEKKKK